MSRRIIHYSIRIVGIIIGVLFLLVRGFALYGYYTDTDSYIIKKLQQVDKNIIVKYHSLGSGENMRYVEMGNKDGPLVVLIYGTPGNILNWEKLLQDTTILQKYHVFIPDRPGFGGSMHGIAHPTIQKQGDMLTSFVRGVAGNKKVTLIGWSYAGALLPYITAMNNEIIESMIIIAGTMDPKNQTIWLITYPLHYTPLRWIIPPMLRVTDSEKLASREQLTRMLPYREKITVPTYLLHGTKDWIVSPENSEFAGNMLIHAPVDIRRIEGVGHEIPIAMPGTVYDALEKSLSQ